MATLSAVNQAMPEKPRYYWARVVSDVLSPPIVWMVASLLVAWVVSNSFVEGVYWAFIYSWFVCIMPVIFILYQVWMGEIGDIHMKYRHERYKPLAITLGSNLVGWALLHALNAPVAIEILAIMSFLEVGIISFVTLYWQISMHTMAITGATMAMGIVFNVPLAILRTPLIMLVGAARMRLDRHTPAQVFAGAMVGAITPVVLFLLASPILYVVL